MIENEQITPKSYLSGYIGWTKSCKEPQNKAHSRGQERGDKFYTAYQKELNKPRSTLFYNSYKSLNEFLEIYDTIPDSEKRFYEQLIKIRYFKGIIL